VLKTVEFPASIPDLTSGLADMNRDTFAHFDIFGLILGESQKVKV
jgi:hypothetical protein